MGATYNSGAPQRLSLAPEPVCRVNPGFNSSFCVLPCDGDGASCPDGMQCVEHPYGFGEICLWKRSYGSP